MKIKRTEIEIECTAEDLRQSNTVADGVLNIIRRLFNGSVEDPTGEKETEEEQANETE